MNRAWRTPNENSGEGDLVPEYLRTGRDREVYGPGEHPFSTQYAVKSSALAIDPNKYMDAIVRDFVLFGGKIVIRKFDTPSDLMSLSESVIVNCTGLGSYRANGRAPRRRESSTPRIEASAA